MSQASSPSPDANLPIDPRECELKLETVRPGHATLSIRVPASLVRRFRKKMRRAGRDAKTDEVKSALTAFCVEQGLKDSGLRAVASPGWMDAERQPSASGERDFAGQLGIDVALELELPDLQDVVLTAPDAPVTDEMVEEEVDAQMRQFGARKPSSETVARGCECVLDISFAVAEGEKSVLKMAGVVVTIPAASDELLVGTLRVPGIAGALCGAAAGDVRTIQGRFPSNLPNAVVRGKPAHVTVAVKEIRTVVPASIEEVLQAYGMPNKDRLVSQIRFALEDKRERDLQAILRLQVVKWIAENMNVEPPMMRSRLLRSKADRQVLGILQARGLPDAIAQAEFERVQPEFHARANRDAKVALVVQSLSSKMKMVLDEDVVAGRIAAMAAERGVRPEALRAELVKSGQFKELIDEIAGDMALDKLVALARTKLVPAAEWEASQGE